MFQSIPHLSQIYNLKQIPILDCPAGSLDLNIIENVCRLFAKEI